jgi:hypothetical protein
MILGAVTSCAAHQPESLGLGSIEEPSAALEPLIHEPYASEASVEAEAPPECLPEGFVPRPPAIPTHAGEPSSGACRAIAKSTRAGLSEELRADWYYEYDNSRLVVDFGCDRLEDIVEITLQYGGGHGGTLDLVRLRPSESGHEWEVLLLRHSAGYYADRGAREGGVHRGRVSADELEHVLEQSRAAFLLAAEEVTAEDVGARASVSSGDFHAFVRLVDDRGYSRAIGFSGYPSSGEGQLGWHVAGLAVWPLANLVESAQLDATSPDDDSRTFFMERFAETEAADYYGEFGAWWVHERLLQMAGVHATVDLVPALGLRLCPAFVDDIAGRAPGGALASMFALLGHDAAIEVDESEILAREQAELWMTACAITCPDAS